MAKIVLMGDASGSVTLQAPSNAGSAEVTLPSVTGDVLISTALQTSSDNATTHKIAIEINGTVYYLLATTSAA